MKQDKMRNEESCALLVMDNAAGNGLIDSLVFCGTLLEDEESLYFEKNKKEGFPLPVEWAGKLYRTPPERAVLFRGCSYFLAVERAEAEDVLQLFDIEERWCCWSPCRQIQEQ